MGSALVVVVVVLVLVLVLVKISGARKGAHRGGQGSQNKPQILELRGQRS